MQGQPSEGILQTTFHGLLDRNLCPQSSVGTGWRGAEMRAMLQRGVSSWGCRPPGSQTSQGSRSKSKGFWESASCKADAWRWTYCGKHLEASRRRPSSPIPGGRKGIKGTDVSQCSVDIGTVCTPRYPQNEDRTAGRPGNDRLGI